MNGQQPSCSAGPSRRRQREDGDEEDHYGKRLHMDPIIISDDEDDEVQPAPAPILIRDDEVPPAPAPILIRDDEVPDPPAAFPAGTAAIMFRRNMIDDAAVDNLFDSLIPRTTSHTIQLNITIRHVILDFQDPPMDPIINETAEYLNALRERLKERIFQGNMIEVQVSMIVN